VAVDGGVKVGGQLWIGLDEEIVLRTTDHQEHGAEFGFKKLSRFCGLAELPVDIVKSGHCCSFAPLTQAGLECDESTPGDHRHRALVFA
jgi:hypothetical protein